MLCTFGMYQPDEGKGVMESVEKYIWGLFAVAFSMFFIKTSMSNCFNLVGQNMIYNIRKNLYLSILKKHIGWHDDRDHSSGILSAILAGDVQLLNGASSESLAIYC